MILFKAVISIEALSKGLLSIINLSKLFFYAKMFKALLSIELVELFDIF